MGNSQNNLEYDPSKVSWATADFVQQAPARLAYTFIYALGILLAGGVVFSVFSKVPMTVVSKGVLVTQTQPVPIFAPESSRVATIHVRENQAIRAGQVLMDTESQLSKADRTRLKSLTDDIANFMQSEQAQGCEEACLSRARSLVNDALRTELKGALRESFVQLQELLREYANDLADFYNLPRLMVEQNRQIASTEEKLGAIKKKGAEKLLAIEVEQLKNKLGGLRSEIQNRRHTLSAKIKSDRDRLEVRLGNHEKNVSEFQRSHELVSPINGVVTGVMATAEGQLLSAGQKLMTIIPADSPLVAEVFIENKDIGRVAIQQKVKLRIDALPEREFGALDGVVAEIPPTISPAAANTTQAYSVRVSLTKQSFDLGQKNYPFRSGMTVTSVIITRKERLIVLAFREILKMKDSFTE